MAKRDLIRSAKSKGGLSALRSRGAAKRSASSPSAKPMRGKRGAIVSISASEARKAEIDWAKVDAASDADVIRHAREDRTPTPSDRGWRNTIQAGHVSLVPPAKVDVRAVREKLHLSQSEFAARFGFTAS